MKWKIDIHKYPSERTRTALKIMKDMGINNDASTELIQAAERKMDIAGVYNKENGASGKVRRCLLTYFKCYNLLDDKGNTTPLGELFADNKISLGEMAFHYLVNYIYSDDQGHRYFPLQLILIYLKKKKELSNESAHFTAYDFSELVELDSLDEVTEEFIHKLLSHQDPSISNNKKRKIGLDIWMILFLISGIFIKIYPDVYDISNMNLINWILESYNNDPQVTRGEVITGILNDLPTCNIINQNTSQIGFYENESESLQAFLFDGVEDFIIKKYLYKGGEINICNMWKNLGIENARGCFCTFSGLERLVGYKLKSTGISEQLNIGNILCNIIIRQEITSEFMPHQKIYYGCPGSGKSFKVKDILKDKKLRTHRTTFHPDTDNASFVGSYRPVMDGKDISYEFVPQVFINAYIDAWNDLNNDYYLVIEEINRGNCAQIFGDLFQLLDRNKEGYSEYPVRATNELVKFLESKLTNKMGISNGELCLPPNLNIYATMNTSDQSLFPMDSAFKRRWDWEYVPIDYNSDNESKDFQITIDDSSHKWLDFLKGVNKKIFECTDSEDKQLGNFFIKECIDAVTFVNKVMFYLWVEVCKDEVKTTKNFFRDKDDMEFSFNSLFPIETNYSRLNDFIEKMIEYGKE